MRGVIFGFLLVINQCVYSQNLVKGLIFDHDGLEIPGVKILETGTTNETASTLNGQFELLTVKDSTSISFSFIGYDTQTIVVTSDTTVNITMAFFEYNSRWLTVGTNYGFVNSIYGLQISNGVDEERFIY